MELFFMMILILIVLVITSVPIGFAIGATGLFLVFLFSDIPLGIVPHMVFNSANSFPLLAVPLFMLTGALLENSKLGDYMINFASSLVGWLRGGLAMVNIVVSMFFAGMSGSSAADVASIGSILIPQMNRKGYPANFSAAVTSASACCSLIIPPSINMILYGVTSETSIAKLFLGGIIPGVMLGVGQMVISYVMATRHDYPVHEPFKVINVWKTFKLAALPLMIPAIILGGILGGIFTPTESAAVAVFIALVLVFLLYRTMDIKSLPKVLTDTSKRTAVVMIMIACSGLLSYFIAEKQLSQVVAEYILSISHNKYLVLLFINIFLLIIGCFINAAAAIVLLVPILLPLVNEIGVNLIHFGIIMTINLAAGTQTPPVGGTMLLACIIGKVSIEDLFKVNKYFLLLHIMVVFIVTYFPFFVMAIPNLMK